MAESSINRLRLLAGLAGEAGVSDLAVDAADLAARIAHGRFFVACIGQFKRGKSTLLNALVGDPVLPVGVAPVTSIATILCYGAAKTAGVRFLDGHAVQVPPEKVAEFVSEAHNPRNRKRVAVVEMTLPSPLLESGMCLVDTPGLGSVFADNTEVTRSFVPHIDAALVAVGADPPVSGEEVSLIAEVAHSVTHLIFVLNKVDRLPDADAREAAEFAARVIGERLGRAVGPFLLVSAAERLAGARTRDWPRLEEALVRLAGASGELVEQAAARGQRRFAARLLRDIDEQRSALLRPIEESERRLRVLQQAADEAGRALRDVQALFAMEQQVLSRACQATCRAFLASVRPMALRELDGLIGQEPKARTPVMRRRAMALARDVARRSVLAWLETAEPQGETLYRQAMARFIARANQFMERLRSADNGPEASWQSLDADAGFTATSEFYFTDLLHIADPTPLMWLFYFTCPCGLALPSVSRRARAYLDRLLVTNGWRVANDIEERVLRSRTALEREIRALLQEAVESARRAVDRARAQQAAGQHAVDMELARLVTLRDRTAQLTSGPQMAPFAAHGAAIAADRADVVQ